jgi:Kef-type K+ transport system membrane component KefB
LGCILSFTDADTAHLLTALVLFLGAAHGCGYLFAHFRQPRVIGEILGGLLLGPTVLGALSPHLERMAFPATGPTSGVLGAIYQLGLLLLMFCSGAEIQKSFRRQETRTVASIAVLGTLLPFVSALIFMKLFTPGGLRGSASTSASLILVFAIAIAITSIPVISRIMADLGILDTSFARIVLGTAVIEDVILYVLLSITLGLVQQGTNGFGLSTALGIDPGSNWDIAYHVIVTLVFFSVLLTLGPILLRWLLGRYSELLRRGNSIAFQLVFMLVLSGTCVFIGVVPLFGAFIGGILVGTSGSRVFHGDIRRFSFAFFIPIFFAVVGWRLDLVRDFDPFFFLYFTVFACAAKALSVFLACRLAGESRTGSQNLAVAMNARGGPAIVLASVALDARIISDSFYASIVVLAIVTSLLAGSWLGYVIRSGKPLRALDEANEPEVERAEI